MTGPGGGVARVTRARGRGHWGQHPCKRHHGAHWGLCAVEAHSKAAIPTEVPDSTLGHNSSEVQSPEPGGVSQFLIQSPAKHCSHSVADTGRPATMSLRMAGVMKQLSALPSDAGPFPSVLLQQLSRRRHSETAV